MSDPSGLLQGEKGLKALRALKTQIDAQAVNAWDRAELERNRNPHFHDPRELLWISIAALTAAVLEFDERLSQLETDGK